MEGISVPSRTRLEVAPPSCETVSIVHVGAVEVQVIPSPVNPVRQAQERLPGMLVQLALTLQPPLPLRHSLMSVHTVPLPE